MKINLSEKKIKTKKKYIFKIYQNFPLPLWLTRNKKKIMKNEKR